MKVRSIVIAAALVSTVTLGGCDKVKQLVGGGKATGQVVATVNGEEITALELRQELGGFSSRDPKVMQAAQQQALQQLILKRILVAKAKDMKLDKGAEFAIQKRRAEEGILVQQFQRQIAGSAAVPTRQEAETYIANNPQKFSDRRILIVDQVVAAPAKISPEKIKALNTLEEVKALFAAEGVQFQQSVATLDTLSVDPRLLTEINKLPPGEVFVLPQGGALLFNRVADTRSVPLTGDAAVAFATNVLRSERARDLVAKQVELERKSAESKITYNEAYKPQKPAASAGAPAAPAAK